MLLQSREINQINTNSTIKIATNVIEELNQRSENSDTKKEGIRLAEARLGESSKKKNGKAK
jgi:hypothetical protein